jgi:hypothetical protein
MRYLNLEKEKSNVCLKDTDRLLNIREKNFCKLFHLIKYLIHYIYNQKKKIHAKEKKETSST